MAAALLALPVPAPVAARAPAPDQRTLALAAGWKALFLCSGTFVAGMAEADIAANDLHGGYPELEPHVAALPASVARAARTVSVGFDSALPPRVARYARGQGCTLLPIGADPPQVMPPAEFIGGPDPKEQDSRPWPQGDAGVHMPQRTWSVAKSLTSASVAKSLTSALVGRAAMLGVLDPACRARCG